MKKLIPILLSFVLILALLPVSPAHADYTCSKCGKVVEKVSKWKSNGNSTHTGICPDCDAELIDCTEKCSGGSASCTTLAVCDKCHEKYGDYGKHNYQPWKDHETITRMYFKCTECGAITWEHNSETWNMKWHFVRYADGEHVKYYKAHSSGPEYNGVLTVITVPGEDPRDKTGEIGLYMTPDDVYVWTWENENRIEFVRDTATLAFDVREISPEMFGLKAEEAPEYYVISLTPEDNGGWLVKAEAMTGEEKTPAQELKGFTLTVDGKETEVTANGVYKPE